MAADRLTVVGRAVPRLDARDKVTGAARYVSDLALPGLAHARVWRSPVPHARIIETLTVRAAAAPGVLAVCAAADLPVKRLYFGPAYRDQPILAHEVIRYAGEPVVAVVADTERHAQAALALVDVRYEELPAATSAEQALAANASLIHPEIERAGHFRDLSGLRPIPGTNVCQHYAYQRGDLAHALEDADLVVEGVYRYPALSHHALEPHCVVARVDGDGLTVWATTQHPFPVRRELADVFDLPLAAVQVVVPLIRRAARPRPAGAAPQEPAQAWRGIRRGRHADRRRSGRGAGADGARRRLDGPARAGARPRARLRDEGRRRHPQHVHRDRTHQRRRQRRRPGRQRRGRPGDPHRPRPDHRRDPRRPVRVGRGRRARHVGHAIRLGDEREPLDDDHGAGGAGGGPRRARAGPDPRGHAARRGSLDADDP